MAPVLPATVAFPNSSRIDHRVRPGRQAQFHTWPTGLFFFLVQILPTTMHHGGGGNNNPSNKKHNRPGRGGGRGRGQGGAGRVGPQSNASRGGLGRGRSGARGQPQGGQVRLVRDTTTNVARGSGSRPSTSGNAGST